MRTFHNSRIGGSAGPTCIRRAAFGLGFLMAALMGAGLFGHAARATPTGPALSAYFVHYGDYTCSYDSTDCSSISTFNLDTDTFASGTIATGDQAESSSTEDEDAILSPNGQTLYVLNDGGENISVIDIATGTVTNTLDLAHEGLYFPYPYLGAISPDGKTLYVSDEDYDIYAINAETGALEATYGTGAAVYPYDLVMGPSGAHVYAALYEGGAGEGALEIIDTQTGQLKTITVSTLQATLPFTYPYALAMSPNGQTAWLGGYPYVASTGVYDMGVAALNLATGEITQEINFGSDRSFTLGQIIASPDGRWLYVTDEESSGQVELVNTATGQYTSVAVGSEPYAEALSPDGTRLYVENNGASPTSVSVIDTNETSAHFGTVLQTITTGVPSKVEWIAMGVPPIYSDPAGIDLEQSAGPVSGTVVPDVVNGTTCPLTYAVEAQPSSGDLSFTDGSFTFTPTLGDLPASNTFSWTATPPATCTADLGPNEVVPARGTVDFVWKPTFGGISPLALTTGQSSGTVSFNLFSSGPVTLTATSSDPAAVPPGSIDLSQNCTGSCTYTLTAGQAGTSNIDLLATAPSGVTASTAFSVTVTAPATSSGGGSGGFGPWVLLGLLGVFLARRRLRLTQA
ncbi:MAG: YncE family protein [Gammaproteobacteria bacterium]